MRVTLTCKKFPNAPLLDVDIWTLILHHILHGVVLGPSFLLEDLRLHVDGVEIEKPGVWEIDK